ncbi:TPA: S41 family peptidase [Candidatus Gracilibacteria bacterium]|nr:S41 family peptidase [Candidatus Gracilibacteria bacterium]HIQ57104.1 S41 family peptidase [Candidatus Gracilibacteria bacterium]
MKFILGILVGVLGGGFIGYFIDFDFDIDEDVQEVSVSPLEITPTPLLLNPANNIKKESDIVSELDNTKFKKVYALLKRNYYQPEDITNEKIEEWLIRGLLYSVEDPYTDYFNEEQGGEFKDEMKGDFEGIGAVLEKRKKNLYVTEVLKKRPAAQSGLLPGDVILEVDEKAVIDETIWETILRIRGEKNTDVVLKVVRKGEVKDIKITRQNIHVENITLKWLGEKNTIAYFDISQFGDSLNNEFLDAYKQFQFKKEDKNSANVSGIIVDLRYNGGGYLDGAVNLASYFLPKGAVVLKVETNKGIESVLKSKTLSVFSGMKKDTTTPLVILVNGGTASSSEIFTSALKEYGRATVVGEKTFGKGVVQQIFPLGFSSDEFVKITIAKWLTPNENNVTHENPIIPDEIVEWDRSKMTDKEFTAEYDPQLEKAIEILGN